jgi:hypothetical protein
MSLEGDLSDGEYFEARGGDDGVGGGDTASVTNDSLYYDAQEDEAGRAGGWGAADATAAWGGGGWDEVGETREVPHNVTAKSAEQLSLLDSLLSGHEGGPDGEPTDAAAAGDGRRGGDEGAAAGGPLDAAAAAARPTADSGEMLRAMVAARAALDGALGRIAAAHPAASEAARDPRLTVRAPGRCV